ncbi:MAG: DNA repair protein RecO [Candidatus Rokuibacteriota bacterium]
MALGKTAAVVIGGFPLGESDRVVTFFSRQYGKIRGVARAARRIRSRFAGALELGTLGELVFFDTGRSDLVRVDHFDVLRPFAHVRDDLGRLGHAAWIVELVGRLTADRDANPAVYGLLVRALGSVDAGAAAGRVAVAFGLRCVEALGHRLRTDACASCGRRVALAQGTVAVDVDAGGVLCGACGAGRRDTVALAAGSALALQRLRAMAWHEATAVRLGAAERELRMLLERQVAALTGHPPRSARFVRTVEELTR